MMVGTLRRLPYLLCAASAALARASCDSRRSASSRRSCSAAFTDPKHGHCPIRLSQLASDFVSFFTRACFGDMRRNQRSMRARALPQTQTQKGGEGGPFEVPRSRVGPSHNRRLIWLETACLFFQFETEIIQRIIRKTNVTPFNDKHDMLMPSRWKSFLCNSSNT